MKNTFGFIGVGNMGGALAKAVASGVAPTSVRLADSAAQKAEELARKLGVQAASNEEIAAECRYIVLGVKPQTLAQLLETLAPLLAARTDEFVLVSMAAGVKMEDVRRMAGGAYPVIRIMPNIPVEVCGGVVLYDSVGVKAEALNDFCFAMRYAGALDLLPEKMIDAGSAITGCGPAFVCLFLEALTDGAVACGLPRNKALAYALQTLVGTARLLQESGRLPAQLKDAVCSPAGSTIAGVRALEDGGLRATTMQAVEAAFKRTQELGK